MSNELTIIEYDGLEIVFDGRKPLLTQAQMASMFGVSRDAVGEVLRNAQRRGFIDLESVTQKLLATASDGKNYQVNHYPMKAILLVGFGVQKATPRVIAFQDWVTGLAEEDFYRLAQEYQQVKQQLQAKIIEVESLSDGYSEMEKDLRTADYMTGYHRKKQQKQEALDRHLRLIDNIED